MHRLGLLLLLLCAAIGSARAADPPAQKFVVFFQEWSAQIDDPAQSVISSCRGVGEVASRQRRARERLRQHHRQPPGQHSAGRSAGAGRGRSVAVGRRRCEAREAARPWPGAVRSDRAGEPAGGNQLRPALIAMLQSLVQAEAWDDPAAVLRRVFGFPGFRGQQEEAVRHVVAGGDALVLAPTGGGKSICFQVPALCRPGTAVVISPLIALMDDQVAALRQLGVSAGALHSDLDPAEARSVDARSDRAAARPAVRLAGAAARQRHAGAAVAPAARAVRDRRGALRVAMGARVPAGVSRAGLPGRSVPRRAAHRADRDRRSAHARRHPARAEDGGGGDLRRQLPSAEPAYRRRSEGWRDRAASGPARTPFRRLRHRLLRHACEDRARCRRS